MNDAASREGGLQPAGVGPDGATFVAVDPAWGPITIYRLHANEETRARLSRRFASLAAWRVDRSLAIRKVDLHAHVVVVERGARTLGEVIASGAASSSEAIARLRLALDVARSLADLHHAGLVHGNLDPSAVGISEDGAALLDPTGLRCHTPNDVVTAACRLAGDGFVSDDLWALGVMLYALIEGAEAASAFAMRGKDERSTTDISVGAPPALSLARELMNVEPAWRPSAAEVVRKLRALCETPISSAVSRSATVSMGEVDTRGDLMLFPSQLGRFRLDELIGEGAMGRVFRATDVNSGVVVAVKVAGHGEEPPTARAIKRFKKEARILSEIKNPGVAALVDFGEDDSCLWMAVEYVEGETLGTFIKSRGPLGELEAVAIIADLCRALVDVHERGIVHRDIKPENVLVSGVDPHARATSDGTPATRGMRVKLIDFGIARHLEETASLALTRQGAVMGTPLYMSPEQARGNHVDVRTDVYALGTLLYELLAGAAPFAGHGAALVLAMQMEKLPTPLAELRPELSAEVCRIVSRCLEKDPDARPQDAREMLASLTRLLEGEPSSIAQHPLSPVQDGLSRWVFEWDLQGTPRELWAFVSSTDRLNRAIGFGAVDEQVKLEDGDPVRFGHNRQAGFDLSWREHPYEWVNDRRIGVLREYSEGPLRLMRSTVDLQELAPTAAGTGARTHLIHTIEVEPRGVLGRAAAAVEIGVKTRRALDRVYHRIDELVQQQARSGTSNPRALEDAFESVEPLSREREERLTALERKVVELVGEPAVVARLGDFLRQAPAPELARIRALALARRMGVDEDALVRVCLVAAREGMLVPLWDLLCPSCRAPAGIEETLRALKDHAHCEVCNIDFALDLATSIELVFKVHPQLRIADAATYCLSSPQKTPHVAAQVRIAAGEHFHLDLALPEGAYQLAGRRLGYSVSLRTRADAPLTRWEMSLKNGPSPDLGRVLRAGRQEIVLVNDTGREQLVRVERTAPRDDVLTAARVAAHPLFRRLYPNEVLSPGALVRIASVVFVHAEVRGLVAEDAANGDAASFSTLYASYKAIESEVGESGGSVVKLLGNGVLAVFDEPAAAVRAALRFKDAVERCSPRARVRAAVHKGPAAAVTMNERLDYFGRSVHMTMELSGGAHEGDVIVSDDVMADPEVQKLLDARARQGLMPARTRADQTDPIAIA